MSVACICLVVLGSALAWPEVTTGQEGDIYVLDNEHMRVEIDAAGGARIRSWVLKPSGRELIALWESTGDIGGALDDRAVFTAQRYDAAIMRPGPEVGTLRFEVRDRSGLGLVKTISLEAGSPALRVTWQLSNGSQAERTLWIRSFLLPGTGPQTEEHLYWVNAGDQSVEGAPDAGGYFDAAEPEVMALWDGRTGDGVMVYAPGVDRFYLWRGSREHPTFEWIYAPVPAGRSMTVQAAMVALEGETEAPDWSALAQEYGADLRGPRMAEVAGWVDEATAFGVTDAERQRGFWLSVGEGDGKRRLPRPLEIDLPRDSARYVSVTLNVLRDLSARLAADVPEDWAGGITVFRDTLGEDRRELLPPPEEPLTMGSGSRETLWLRVASTGRQRGAYEPTVALTVGETAVEVPLRVRVWDVSVEDGRPFHVRGYCGGFPVWAGGYEIDDAKLRRLEAILKAFAEMGGDVLDWNANWVQILDHVRVAETGEVLREVSEQEPERLDLDDLPELDFSYYDPWLELAKQYGVTRLETYMMHPGSSRIGWKLLSPAVGKGRVEPGTPEARRVMVWFWREMRRELAERGFEGLFCKVSDEISPEHIPSYIETAELARQAGWRPFTTITGMVARTAEHLNALNPHCDQWQLGYGSKDTFLDLVHTRYEVAEETHELAGPWAQYRNGGAEDTWVMRVFGEGGPVQVAPQQVESLELFEDGQPLQKEGGSPWGNTDRGVVITGGALHQVLYVSPREGTPEDHAYELRITVRRPSPHGRPLVTIDESDEVWFYGGGSRPFRRSYHSGWVYPVMALYHDFDGYGLWAFLHWNRTENIIWVDEETAEVTVSPAYCGYRDGWHDTLLLSQLIRERGREAFDAIVAEENAVLDVDMRTSGVYHFRTIVNAADPVAVNTARRRALEALAEGG